MAPDDIRRDTRVDLRNLSAKKIPVTGDGMPRVDPRERLAFASSPWPEKFDIAVVGEAPAPGAECQ
jgi:hypothetical protein